MPTKEQLSKSRASEFEYFTGGKQKSDQSNPQEGEVIGTITYDPNKKDLKVKVKNQSKEVPKAASS